MLVIIKRYHLGAKWLFEHLQNICLSIIYWLDLKKYDIITDIKITENIHTDNMNIKMFIICWGTSYTWLEHFNISRKEVWLFSFTMHIMFKTNLMKCNKAYSSNYTISAHKGSTKINELIEDAFVSRIKSFVIPKLR